jgi:DNA-binding SARP family transcriptional activator
MAVAELTLLGGFELRLASGEAIDLPGQKDRALLAVLALRPGSSFSREKLAGLLWSDRGDAQARDSLKHSLSRLRQLFAFTTAQPVIADRHSVRFDASEVGVDVALFEQLSGDGTTAAWERAARLYRGDFLDGIAVRDPAFDDWLDVERQRLRHAGEQALETLIGRYLEAGAAERAEEVARRLLSLDPLCESACRALMEIDAARARPTEAIKRYEAFRDRLKRDLRVEPEPGMPTDSSRAPTRMPRHRRTSIPQAAASRDGWLSRAGISAAGTALPNR